MVTEKEFLKGILEPGKEYYPVVMWFWNDEITEDEIEFQIKEFKKQKIYEFFIHPMFGFCVDYLSERFFELIKHAVKVAKKEDMKFWIYDEYNWPSGTAGAKLIKDHPWTKCSILKYLVKDIDEGQSFSGKLSEEVEGELIAANFVTENESYDITDELNFDGELTTWENKKSLKGKIYFIFKNIPQIITETARWAKYSNYEPGYADLMNEEAMRLFIEYTHENYKKYIGDEFGKTVKGLFTDEPAVSVPGFTQNGSYPWSITIPEKFKKLKGYDLMPHIHKLFLNTEDDDVLKIKRDYWDTLTIAFQVSFIEQCANWCKKNNLLLTGHFVGEEYMLLNQELFVNFYNGLKFFDVPGMDTIFSKQFIEGDRFNLAGTMTGSLIHYAGKERFLSETYTGSGWDMTMNEMRKIANRILMQGVNMLMFMGAYYSIKGFRKISPGGYPPSHSYHNSQFKYYNILNDYTAVMSYINAKTVQTGKTMVIHPTTTGSATSEAEYRYYHWFAIDYYQDGTYNKVDSTFCGVVNALTEMNKGFEIGFEDAMIDATVKGNKLILANTEYEVIILPALRYLRTNTVKLLEKFIENGGKVIFVNDFVRKDYDTLKEPSFVITDKDALKSLSELNENKGGYYSRVKDISENIKLVISNETDFKRLEGIIGSLTECYDKFGTKEEIEISGAKKVFINRRVLNGDYVITIINDEDVEKEVKIKLNTGKKALIFDPVRKTAIKPFSTENEKALTLKGYDIKVIFTGNKIVDELEKGLPVEKEGKPKTTREIEIKDTLFKPLGENTLALNYKTLKEDKLSIALTKSDDEVYDYVSGLAEADFDFAEEKYGDSWQGSAANQRAYTYIGWDKRFVVKSNFTVAKGFNAKVKLIHEGINEQKFIVNGKLIDNFETVRVWDFEDKIADITPYLKEGENTICVIGKTPEWQCPHCVSFAALSGDFKVNSDRSAVYTDNKPITLGSISGQGYPSYSGSYVYRTSFTVNEFENVVLKVKTDEFVEVKVNGKSAGTIMSDPYTLDITGFAVKGENSLELTLTSKMNNLFDKPTDSGLYEIKILY